MPLRIRLYNPQDEDAVIALWEACELTRPWNPPKRDILDKQAFQPELFLVAELDGEVIGSVMGGYEGHRGIINYLAIHPDHQNQGHATKLLSTVEMKLLEMGCPKINLMIRTDNLETRSWYQNQGYALQDCIVLGKRLKDD